MARSRTPVAGRVLLRACLAAGLACGASAACALDLAQAWQAALANDAQWRGAQAAAASNRERVPQALAQLRPQVSANVQRFRNELSLEEPGIFGNTVSQHEFYSSGTDQLTVRQALIRPQADAQLRVARATVGSSEAQLQRAQQDLATRLAQAYVEALLAEEQLRLIHVQREAYTAQADAARKGFAAGSGTRTDIDEAQARLDLNAAQEIEARQAVDYARRELAVIVGEPVTALAPLVPERLPLVVPQPANLEAWIDRAEQASPELRAAVLQLDAAKEQVRSARAGGSPTIDLVGQMTRSLSETPNQLDQRYFQKSIGFQLNVPLYAGGAIDSQVRQALADQDRQEQVVVGLRQDLAVRVQREFRGITEGIARVHALEQAVRSGEQLVVSNRRSQQAGARTVVDILNAQQQLGQTQRDLAQARYAYVLALLRLKALAGEIDASTIAQVNGWLQP